MKRIFTRVWRRATSYPQPDAKRFFTQPWRLATQVFQRTEQQGRSLKLLRREQAQRIPHQHIATTRISTRNAIKENSERRQSKIGLCFAAASREPDQIDNLT